MKQLFSHLRRWQLAVGLLAGLRAQAQAPAWQTAVALGPGSSAYTVTETKVDASGAVYLAGYFSGTVSFGTVALVSAGSQDGFVAKWNSTGIGFAWVQQAGGPGAEAVTALAVSGANVYVGGTYGLGGSTVALGSLTLTNTDATNASKDAFVAKLTDAGAASTFTWAHRIGSATTARGTVLPPSNVADDLVSTLLVDGANVYASSIFEGGVASIDGSVAFTDNTGTSYVRSHRLLVAKFIDSGSTSTLGWANGATGPNMATSSGITLSGKQFLAVSGNNVYVSGVVSGSEMWWGGFNAGAFVIMPCAGTSIYVAKFNSGFAWFQRVSTASSFQVTGLAANGANLYLAGQMTGRTANFGYFTGPFPSLTNPDVSGASPYPFLAKLTDAGTTGSFAWVQGIANQSQFQALAASGPNLYLAGSFTGTVNFGSTALTSTANSADVVVVKFTDAGSAGALAWVQQAGGSANDYATALAISGSTVKVTGTVGAAATFGSQVVTGALGSQTTFLASFTDPALVTAVASPASFEMGLFPNPTRGGATVQLPPGPGTVAATLTVFDAVGRAVLTQRAVGARTELDLKSLAPGIYALRVTVGAASATRRLVVE
ncbi:T9SS type A sorting domain-containing protein [Hymenobacter armeniacus]|uniref:T9SS type A sorting domain-containing protein n=1 Tax=Hymenobacter armeniacus TaxID=2771358 RepID=A0ABR8JTL7_9BACT|nr:T9SS type A sorting domain-containing protein [Hymenobacter armeniacus]MBD2723300.1 T9SS type A sorting domain-containing protein [Hymenobacter armeniacus]